jgi:hypothetical protein
VWGSLEDQGQSDAHVPKDWHDGKALEQLLQWAEDHFSVLEHVEGVLVGRVAIEQEHDVREHTQQPPLVLWGHVELKLKVLDRLVHHVHKDVLIVAGFLHSTLQVVENERLGVLRVPQKHL